MRRVLIRSRLQTLALACSALAAGALGCTAQRPTQPSVPASDLSLPSGDHDLRIRHAGRDRRYFVRVPETLGLQPAVMVGLHGGGGNASGFKDDYGLDEIADREGFIAVYPDGTGVLPNRLLTWNGGDHCCGYAHDKNVDDVGFLLAVLDDLAKRTRYDARRVYVTGHSNGSIMAYRLAAEAPDRIAAIVPVAGAMGVTDVIANRGVPVLHIHSIDDPRALYEGGSGPPFPGTSVRIHHVPVQTGLDYWVGVNGCNESPSTVSTQDGRGSDRGQRLVHLKWSGCSEGTVVEHMRLEGVGHGWPGVEAGRLVQRILGPPTTLIHASEEAWAFASQFSR